MSEMSLHTAIRAKQPESFKIEDLTLSPSDKLVNYDKYDDESEDFIIKNKDFEIVLIKIDDNYFADYYLSNEHSAYEVDENISLKLIKSISSKMKKRGLDVSDVRVRVLYFYNGGSGGLLEHE